MTGERCWLGLAFAAALAAPATSVAQTDEFHSSGRACGYPNATFDFSKVEAAAGQYPNPRILILTPAEKQTLQQELHAWNAAGRRPVRGMAPCFNCSPEFEACIVYERPEESFASRGEPVSERPPGGDTGGPQAGDRQPRLGRSGSSHAAASCRNQVEVLRFAADTSPGFSSIPGRRAWPDGTVLDTFSLWATTPGRQGIRLLAEALVIEGAIPPARIGIRFVQNTTDYRRTLFNAPLPPDVHRLADPQCKLPLLDLFRLDQPPPPFYRLDLDQRMGDRRLIEMHDTPNLQNIPIALPGGARLVGLDATFGYSTYLGCVVDDDPTTFETLERIDWEVRFKGDIIHSSPAPADPPGRHHLAPAWATVGYRFDLFEPGAGIWAGDRISTREQPRTSAPTFNSCLRAGP